MKNYLVNSTIYILTTIFVFVMICFILMGLNYCKDQRNKDTPPRISQRLQPQRTDTLIVDTLPEITVKVNKIEKPRLVTIQREADTLGRKIHTTKKIVKGVKLDFVRNTLDVHTISPKAINAAYCYDSIPLPNVAQVVINDTGAVEIIYKTEAQIAELIKQEKAKERREFWRGVWRGVIVATTAIAAAIIIGNTN